MLSQFQKIGNDLFRVGIVPSHSGNMSLRMGEKMIITRRGCNLGSLEENDLIETGIVKNDRYTPLASTELPVHRAIYRETSAQAIIHAHPPYAVALSLVEKEIESGSVESDSLLGKIPVLGWGMEVKPGGLAEIVAEGLKDHLIVVVRGHGTFAIGQLLEEAHHYTTALEESCKVLCLLKSLNVNSTIEK